MTFGINNVVFRKAQLQDLDTIKKLVDQHKKELGFVIRGALERSINTSELIVAEDQTKNLLGFVHYRHRKDKQTTLYNIVVDVTNRRAGLGKLLLDELKKEALNNQQTTILLKCPEDLSANQFYLNYGFTLARREEGKHKPLNIWSIDL